MIETFEYSIPPAEIMRRGPYILVEIGGGPASALLDTGASFSAIDIATARDLQLPEDANYHHAVGATGGGTYPRFQVNLHIPLLRFTVSGPIRGLPLTEHGVRWVAIIGRDVLCQYEFTVNGRTGLIRFVSP